jgi:hypothetical protein
VTGESQGYLATFFQLHRFVLNGRISVMGITGLSSNVFKTAKV